MSGFAEYPDHDALSLADLVRRKEVSPVTLIDEAVRCIEKVNPTLNAVISRMYETARREAEGPLADGPFTGVPFVLKDLVSSAAGTQLTGGSKFMKGYQCGYDSELVKRYRAAGVLFVARTASPEFGLLPVTESMAYGPTSTPWQPGLASGGSSGGSAALVAAGAMPMGHGGDGGGSIRIPASCCGIFGLKPSRARTPTGPDAGEHWHGLAVEHVLTRSVRDSAAMLDATCAPEAGAPYAAPHRERPYLEEVHRTPVKLRIGFTADPILPSNVHPDCIAAVQDAAQLCASLGHDVIEAAPKINRTEFAKDLLTLIASEVAAEVRELEHKLGRKHRADELETPTQLLALFGNTLTGMDLCESLRRMRAIGRTMADFHQRYDLLLTPTLAAPPPLHGALRPKGVEDLAQWAIARSGLGGVMKLPGVLDGIAAKVYDFIPYTPLANATGAPSMNVPLFWNRNQLPIGVMFTAPYGDEATLFRLAGQLEQARPWAKRRPKVHAGI